MSEFDKHLNRAYSKFENMSTEALEEILRQDSQLPDNEESDLDAILYIMEVIAKREKEQLTGRFTNVKAAWDSFNEYYRPSSDDSKSLYEDEDTSTISCYVAKATPFTKAERSHTIRKRGLLRISSVAAVLVVIVFSGSLTAYALGYDLWEVIAQWTKGTFGFEAASYIGDAGEKPQTNSYSCLEDALNDYGIEGEFTPAWIPEDFFFDRVTVTSTPSCNRFVALYKGETDNLTLCIYSYFEGGEYSTYEKDKTCVKYYSSGGITHYIMANEGRLKAVWQNNSCECSITGSISEEILERIIDSIYER